MTWRDVACSSQLIRLPSWDACGASGRLLMRRIDAAVLLMSSCVSSTAMKITPLSRRACITGAVATAFTTAKVSRADTGLGYTDNAGMKSYSSVQRAWEKSAGMSQREILLAARGASSNANREGEESSRSKKRRAMAGCKDDVFRRQAGYETEAACNSRVLGGDPEFMLEVMDAD